MGKAVYVIYDSVLTLSSNNLATQGEVRLAKRSSIFPEDWLYSTLDGPDSGVSVAGYDVSISTSGNRIAAAWLASSGLRLPSADEVRFSVINEDESPSRLSPEKFGVPGSPLLIDSKGLIFGCQQRLCSVSSYGLSPQLKSSATLNEVKDGAIVTINKVRYAVTSISKKLVLIRI